MAILDKIRLLNNRAFIIVRSKKVDDIEELYNQGANQVIPEEFETAIEMFKRILIKHLVPRNEIEYAIAKIRDENYGIFREQDEDTNSKILKELPNIEIIAMTIHQKSFLVNKSTSDVRFRKTYGISLVAIKREDLIIDHPIRNVIFEVGDIAYFLGTPDQIAKAIELFSNEI